MPEASFLRLYHVTHCGICVAVCQLCRELVQAHYPGDVVFTTAASDMETVSEAVRCGVFDYLIKPIAYERLGQTLTRFRQRKHMLENGSKTSS